MKAEAAVTLDGATPVYAILGYKCNPYCLIASGSPFKYRVRAAPVRRVKLNKKERKVIQNQQGSDYVSKSIKR